MPVLDFIEEPKPLDFQAEAAPPLDFQPEPSALTPLPASRAGGNFQLRPISEPARSPEEQSYRNMTVGRQLGLPQGTGPDFDKGAVPFSKLTPTAKTVMDALQELSSSSPDLTPEEAEAVEMSHREPDRMAKVIAGTLSAVNKTAESMTSPKNAALLAGATAVPAAGIPAAGRIISGLFTADMARQMPELYRRTVDAFENGDEQAQAEALSDLALTGAFVGSSGLHTLKGSPRPSPIKPMGEVPRGTTPEPARETPGRQPADTSQTALQELEAALRGNQLRPKETSGETKETSATERVDFQPEPARAEPTAGTVGVEVARQPTPVLPEPQPPPVGAETITGPPSAAVEGEGNERTGSEIPAEREKRPTPTGRASRERPPDLIDEILAQVGHIDPTLIRQANPDWKPVGAARALFRRGGIPADSAISGVTYETGAAFGVTADMPLDQFGDAINAAAMARRGQVAQASKERASLDAEAAQALKVGKTRAQFEQKAIEGQRPKSGPAAAPVPVDGLVVGDRFKVQDVTFAVSGLETDPDGNLLSVTLKDGPKFGVQRVGGNAVIHVDEGTMRRNRKAREQATQFLPEEKPAAEQPAPLELAKPESVEEQRARTEAETQRATEAEQRRKVQEGAAKPLTGSVGEIGQGDLLGGGDLFSGAKPKPDAVEGFLDRLKIDTGPDQLHAFGLVPELWNGLIETVRIAYRAGRTIHEAIQDGIDWLRRAHPQATFDEPAVRAHFQEELARRGADILPDTPAGLSHERLGEIATEAREMRERMRAMRTAGREVPQSMRDRVDELQSLVDEASHAAPRARGGIPATPEPQPTAAPPAPAAPPRELPAFTGPEKLANAHFEDLTRGLRAWRAQVAERFARRKGMNLIAAGRDAADNRADLSGNESGNFIRHMLNRAFGERNVNVKRGLREYALSFVVEAKGDRGALVDFYDGIAGGEFADTKWGRRSLDAIRLASQHWDRFAPTAEAYRRLTEAERETEVANDVNTREWSGGYVHHTWEDVPNRQLGAAGGVDPTQPQGAATPFTRSREYPTLAEGIAQGGIPKTLNAVELLSKRIADGQRKLNEIYWIDGLRTAEDPVSGEPIVTSVMRQPRRPMQGAATGPETFEAAAPAQFESKAPPGYRLMRFGDVEVAVKDGYQGLLSALTSKSWLRNGGFPELVQKAFAVGKHFLLFFDTMHPMWVMFNRLPYLGRDILTSHLYKRGVTLLDSTLGDIQEMVRRGEIPQSWGRQLAADKADLDALTRAGYNVGGIQDVLFHDWVHKLPISGTFNKWAFGQFIRGAMAEAGLIELHRLRQVYPEARGEAIERTVARDLNARFGNLGRQGLFRSRTAQDIARLVALAPQFNESLLRSEVGATYQTLRLPDRSIAARKLVMGSLLKSAGPLIVGMFAANQIINMVTRGKPTWENEEEGFGPKISAWIPDFIGGGKGFFLNPLSIAMRLTTLVEDTYHQTQDPIETLRRVGISRLSSPARSLVIGATKRTATGKSLRGDEVLPAMLEAIIPAPISASAVYHGGKEIVTGQPSEQFPGQFQKQLASSLGVHLKTAPTEEQRIGALAREFNREKGIMPSAEFYSSDFADLEKALRIGNQSDARDAMEELLGKKTRAQILEHFTRWVSAPYTGQRAREGEFMRGLSAEQRQAYLASRDRRRELARAAYELLRSMPQTSVPARR